MTKERESSAEWCTVDASCPVRQGLIGRDAVYRLIREGRIAHIRISKRRLLVRQNFFDELVCQTEAV